MNGLREGWTLADVEAAIVRDDPAELAVAVIWVSLDPPMRIWSEHICVLLSGHRCPRVRGNAILGFGHLARIYRYLNRRLVQPIIEAGLKDSEFVVREQADAAASDVEWYLGWRLFGREDEWRRPTCC